MKTLLLLICICGCFSACSLGFAKNEQVVGKYHIIAIDVADDACLAYEVGTGNFVSLVPAQVVAYAKSKHFLFAKQSAYAQKDTALNYYIIPIVEDTVTVYPEGRIIGPLKMQEFNKEILGKGMKNIVFEEVN